MAVRFQPGNEVQRHRVSLKKNDTVQVISGKDAGKQGKVLKVIPEKNRVIVQGVGFIKRHTRPNPQRNIKGGIAEREAPIHASNVQIVCGECGKKTRVGHKILADGRKVRICRHCEGVLDK
jgi:large subunit ribosomal protein L24